MTIVHDDCASAFTACNSAFTPGQIAAINGGFTIFNTNDVACRTFKDAVFNDNFAVSTSKRNPSFGFNGAITINCQLSAIHKEERTILAGTNIVSIQIKNGIRGNIIGFIERQIRGQSDIFSTFGKGLFEVPYSTDISRGY